jgi:hypothetical protein
MQIGEFCRLPGEYASDQVAREQANEAVGYQGYAGEVESSLRADFLAGAQRLARDINAADAAGQLRTDLLADAFGVAQWAIGVPAGEQVPPERLALLPDERLRFTVGLAAAAMGPLIRAFA